MGLIWPEIWPILIRDYLPKRKNGPSLETDELSMIFLKFRKIADNLPRSDEALFRTLTPARNYPFLEQFYPATRGPDSVRHLANSYSLLATERGNFRRQMDYP